jgi:hypothetical protein
MKNNKLYFLLLLFLLVLSACAPQTGQTSTESQELEEEIAATDPGFETPEEEGSATVTPKDESSNNSNPPPGAVREFTTDFSKHTIPFDESLSGGPSKDGIPPVDNPSFVSVEEADEWLDPREPVIRVLIDQTVKAYPIQILMWHEIVNDIVGGSPIVVSYCPLCNTAIVFDRTVDGQVLDFGTSGRLRYSNLIMYDRQTESWWQQGTGEAIVGELLGAQLEFVPATMISWDTFKEAYPEGVVLSRETGHNRPYGSNPYTGYDAVGNIPFLYQGPETPDDLPPVARILGLDVEGEAVAYPYPLLREFGVVNDQGGEKSVVIFWVPGTASALDTQFIADGKDVGAAIAFNRVLNGQELSFRFDGEAFIDNETGSTWNFLGNALSGPLQGERLEEVVANNYLWFAWAAFKPETRIFEPGL